MKLLHHNIKIDFNIINSNIKYLSLSNNDMKYNDFCKIFDFIDLETLIVSSNKLVNIPELNLSNL